jgi:DIS3-like exonuclease 2
LVQEILDGKITKLEDIDEALRPDKYTFEEMAEDCFIFNEIAHNRRKWRFDTGSISVENPEYYFELDDNDQPMQFSEQRKIESKELIEEYMLIANMLVSEYLVKFCKDKAVLRAQLPPKEEKVEDMIEYFHKVNADVDITSSLTTQKSFEKLKQGANTALYYCCMRKYFSNIREANYITRGINEPQEVRHYSLNFDLYTHFTSPIRRYPDLLVHRQLTLALAHQDQTREVIENIDYKKFVEYCSERYLTAKYASSTCTKLYHCIFLKNTQVREGVDAYVYDVNAKNIFFYIASINVNYKMDIKKDFRVSSYYILNDYTVYLLFKEEKETDKGTHFSTKITIIFPNPTL